MRLSREQKRQIIDLVLKNNQKISDVAQRNKIARKTLYAWIKRYQGAKGRAKGRALENHYIKGAAHPKFSRNK